MNATTITINNATINPAALQGTPEQVMQAENKRKSFIYGINQHAQKYMGLIAEAAPALAERVMTTIAGYMAETDARFWMRLPNDPAWDIVRAAVKPRPLTYDDHIERTATAVQRLDQADRREDFAAVARAHERYMELSDAAEAYCTANGISRDQFNRDVNRSIGF